MPPSIARYRAAVQGGDFSDAVLAWWREHGRDLPVAPDARPVRAAGGGGDAAADAGDARRRPLDGLARALAGRRVAGRRDTGRGAAGLAGHGLQPPRPQPPPRIEGRGGGRAGRRRSTACVALPGVGPLHRRARWRCRRSEPTSCRSTSTSAACSSAPSAAPTSSRRPGARRTSCRRCSTSAPRSAWPASRAATAAPWPPAARRAAGATSRPAARAASRGRGGRPAGRLLDRLREGPVALPDADAEIVAALVRDGLAVVTNRVVTLPTR